MRPVTGHAVPLVFAGVLTALLVSRPGWAIDVLDSPNVEKGAWALEYAGSRTFDHHSALDNIQGHKATASYAPTERWKTGVSALFGRDASQSATLETIEWENIFEFSGHGKSWVDSGMSVAYLASARGHRPDAIEARLLLEKAWKALTHRASIGLEQAIGKEASGGPEFSVLWNSRYALSAHFAPGFEIQSGFGQLNKHVGFQKQEHYIGPALYGRIFENIGYEAVLFFGLTDASSQVAMRFLLEYQAQF